MMKAAEVLVEPVPADVGDVRDDPDDDKDDRIVRPYLNANAYRSSDGLAPQSYLNADAIGIADDGSSFVARSDLTGREWNSLLRVVASPVSLLHSTTVSCLRLDNGVADGRFFPDSSRLAIGDDAGQLTLFDGGGDRWKSAGSAVEHDEAILCLDIFADGGRIVTGGADHVVKVWDATLTSVRTIRPAHERQVSSVAARPDDSSCFLSAGIDGVVASWDIRDNTKAQILMKSDCGVRSVVWLSDTQFAVGHEDGLISIADLAAPHSTLSTMKLSEGPVHRLVFNRRLNCLAACGDSTAVSIFKMVSDRTKPQPDFEYRPHSRYVRGLAWHHRDPALFSCGWDGTVVQKDLSHLH